ncbi:MAG: PaaI family thioesterase [Pseudomonadota bacterium]|nr:PaaI family thioesterase [Pseudomonadota bacterium]
MLSADAVQKFFTEMFPQSTAAIQQAGEGRARVRQIIDHQHLRPGGTVSGPVMMAVADWAAYAAILAEIGIVPLAVTTSLNINFLRRPSPQRAIIGEARLLKLGRRLAVAEVNIFSEGESALVAHATLTYSIPPRGE